MDIIIKLADSDLVSIETDTRLKGDFDYYYTEPTDERYWNERFIFKFSDGSGYVADCSDVNKFDFCAVVSFFYGKDFSNTTKEQFCKDFYYYLHPDKKPEE